MTPTFLTEIRSHIESEVDFWQVQAQEIREKAVTQSEAFVKEARERLQTTVDAQSALATSLWKHNVEAAERSLTLLTNALRVPV